MKVLAAQGSHFCCRDAGWCQPGGQSTHDNAASSTENVPALQAVQLGAAKAGAKNPTVQLLHAAAAEAENLPGTQASHSNVPPREKRPASQALHAVAAETLFVAKPASQKRQSPFCALRAYLPALHGLHSAPRKLYSPA